MSKIKQFQSHPATDVWNRDPSEGPDVTWILVDDPDHWLVPQGREPEPLPEDDVQEGR
jgi:hypothetical protein